MGKGIRVFTVRSCEIIIFVEVVLFVVMKEKAVGKFLTAFFMFFS